MANVLTDLAADIYVAADVVARELVGIAPSVTLNANASDRVAVGGVVRSHFTRPAVAGNVAPSMTIPEGTDQTIDNKTLTITKSRSVPIPWTGEDMRFVNAGSGFSTIYGDQIAQAMRTLTNEIEQDLWLETYRNASRAFGTAGTNPFASNFDAVAEVRQILVDNGMPTSERQTTLAINTIAGTKLRNLASLQRANEAGNDQLLRQGVLLDLQGLMMKESAQIGVHTAGTGTGYLVNNVAGYAVGATSIAVDTGTGTILKGDTINFGDGFDYVVDTALTGGTVVIAEPGLRAAIADGATVTVRANATKNVAFHRRAVELVMRPPAVPEGGDAAVDSMIVQDPRSGLVFEIRVYKGYRKTMFEVAAAWGQKAWLPKFIAQLNG